LLDNFTEKSDGRASKELRKGEIINEIFEFLIAGLQVIDFGTKKV
jgi:hypothetical protein